MLKLNRLPKIQSKSLTEPYIQDHNGIAYADSARLVDDEQRKLSSVIRRVEPTTTKRNVRYQSHLRKRQHDEILPKTS